MKMSFARFETKSGEKKKTMKRNKRAFGFFLQFFFFSSTTLILYFRAFHVSAIGSRAVIVTIELPRMTCW